MPSHTQQRVLEILPRHNRLYSIVSKVMHEPSKTKVIRQVHNFKSVEELDIHILDMDLIKYTLKMGTRRSYSSGR